MTYFFRPEISHIEAILWAKLKRGGGGGNQLLEALSKQKGNCFFFKATKLNKVLGKSWPFLQKNNHVSTQPPAFCHYQGESF